MEGGFMKEEYIIAYDLGTGGLKASLYDAAGRTDCDIFEEYPTFYPHPGYHEQDPGQWWDAILKATRALLEKSGLTKDRVRGISISGHSLGVIPIDKNGNLLLRLIPIWSDKRAVSQAESFFQDISYRQWYERTGNGFPRECYPIFKLMWLKEKDPDLFTSIYKVLGSKDYINFKLTGNIYTDPSYASGSGFYDLHTHTYIEEYLQAAGISPSVFPGIIPSHAPVGTLTKEAARALGLSEETTVFCGGVDNSCMALGAKGIRSGRVYASLGSSAWIAAVTKTPLLDFEKKPFVFEHCVDGLYTSATSIFASGSSFQWLRDHLCQNLSSPDGVQNLYALMDEKIRVTPVGSNCLFFNPSLAGGSMIEESPHITGGYVGLTLAHTQNDLIRATLEGITYNLRYALEILQKCYMPFDEILLVGGGSNSRVWMQMIADIFRLTALRTNITQNAASLGAAALASYGLGYWSSFDPIDTIHKTDCISTPIEENAAAYDRLYPLSRNLAHYFAQLGEEIWRLRQL